MVMRVWPHLLPQQAAVVPGQQQIVARLQLHQHTCTRGQALAEHGDEDQDNHMIHAGDEKGTSTSGMIVQAQLLLSTITKTMMILVVVLRRRRRRKGANGHSYDRTGDLFPSPPGPGIHRCSQVIRLPLSSF
jgi:hypothetical protein